MQPPLTYIWHIAQKLGSAIRDDYKRSDLRQAIEALRRTFKRFSRQGLPEEKPAHTKTLQDYTLEDKAIGDAFELTSIFNLRGFTGGLNFESLCLNARKINPDYEVEYDASLGKIVQMIDEAVEKYKYAEKPEERLFRNWIYFYLTTPASRETSPNIPNLFNAPKKRGSKKRPFIDPKAVAYAIKTWDEISQDHRFQYAQLFLPPLPPLDAGEPA